MTNWEYDEKIIKRTAHKVGNNTEWVNKEWTEDDWVDCVSKYIEPMKNGGRCSHCCMYVYCNDKDCKSTLKKWYGMEKVQ